MLFAMPFSAIPAATVFSNATGNPEAHGIAAAAQEGLFSWAGYFQALAWLFLLLACLWAALWYLKRKGGLRLLGVQEGFTLESRLSLGPKQNLIIARVANKRLLLGATDQQITLLAELPTRDIPEQTPQQPEETTNSSEAATFEVVLDNKARDHHE